MKTKPHYELLDKLSKQLHLIHRTNIRKEEARVRLNTFINTRTQFHPLRLFTNQSFLERDYNYQCELNLRCQEIYKATFQQLQELMASVATQPKVITTAEQYYAAEGINAVTIAEFFT